ncbi:MAG: CDP-alcohol phosphatidyltransferase family protein [Methylococcaceae bacterium]
MNARHIPNIISVARIVLVGPILVYLLNRQFAEALALMVVAGLSDGLDGWLARRYHWQSRLGSYLDPAADKVLLLTGYVALTSLSLIPLGLAVTIVLRDVVILTGAAAYYWLIGPFEGKPLWISKLNTVLQLILLIASMLHQSVGFIPALLLNGLMALVFVTTVTSGLAYVYVWSRKFAEAKRHSG